MSTLRTRSMQDNSSRPVVEPSSSSCRNAKARGFAGMSYNLSCSTSARMQLFALTTSHLGQFSERLRRVADIFSSFSRFGLHFPCTIHAVGISHPKSEVPERRKWFNRIVPLLNLMNILLSFACGFQRFSSAPGAVNRWSRTHNCC